MSSQVMSPKLANGDMMPLQLLLQSSKYNEWKDRVENLLACQGLIRYVDGTLRELSILRKLDADEVLESSIDKRLQAQGILRSCIPRSMRTEFGVHKLLPDEDLWNKVLKVLARHSRAQIPTLEQMFYSLDWEKGTPLVNVLDRAMDLRARIKNAGGKCSKKHVWNAIQSIMNRSGESGKPVLRWMTRSSKQSIKKLRKILIAEDITGQHVVQDGSRRKRPREETQKEVHVVDRQPRKKYKKQSCQYCINLGRGRAAVRHDDDKCWINPKSPEFKGDEYWVNRIINRNQAGKPTPTQETNFMHHPVLELE